MAAVSISHARENLFPLVRQVNEDHVVIEIVARNGGNAVHILRGLAEARDGAAQPTELEALAARFDVQAEG